MAETDDGPVVVADAGPLIHLDELDVISVLEDFRQILIPVAVWLEVDRHRAGACDKLDRSRVRRLDPLPDVPGPLAQWAKVLALGRGEIEALHWMGTVADAIFLTDDAGARLAAVEMRYRVHGTIGVLLRAVRRGVLTVTRARELVESIRERSTLHLRQDLVDAVLRELEAFHRER